MTILIALLLSLSGLCSDTENEDKQIRQEEIYEEGPNDTKNIVNVDLEGM